MSTRIDTIESEPRILLGDDSQGRLQTVRQGLESEGIPFRIVRGGQEALRALRDSPYDVVALPERLEDASGAALLRKWARQAGSFVPIFLKEHSTQPTPDLPQDTIVLPIENAAEIVSTLAGAYRERMASAALDRIVGESERIRQIKQIIRQVAPTKLNVLVTGESGTGKELVAHAIHELSPRRNAPFITVNAGALPEGILESELFGHERGAFTGAYALRKGRFELADRGTLFLDEIGTMPPDIQVKLLRVLEESRFLRVGGARNIEVDVRLITATNSNLEAAVEAGRFRHDLYFRLNVIHIDMPPLRERRNDIALLVSNFVAAIADENGVPPIRFGKEALDLLVSYHWPGNIRELRNIVEKVAVLNAGKEVGPEIVESAFGRRFRRGANLPALIDAQNEEANPEIVYRTLLGIRSDIADIKALLAAGGRFGGPLGSALGAESPLGAIPGLGSAGEKPRRHAGELEPVDAIVAEAGESAAQADLLRFADLEKDAIRRALRRTGGNRRRAASLLGIGERTLYRKIREYGLSAGSSGSR